MKNYPPSQDEVVQVLIKTLNTERGMMYTIGERPDEVERNLPAIDYVLRAPDGRHPEVAVEVSSTWRSESAGKEDADWRVWTEAVSARASGKLPGKFLLSTPMQIPRDLDAGAFADALIDLALREQPSLQHLWREGKGSHFTVCGLHVFLTNVQGGSELMCGRMLSARDGEEFPANVGSLLEKKSGKLKAHKAAGRETWVVVYNTFWTAMSQRDVRAAVLAALGAEHAHIDAFGVVSGNPPDDARLDTIR